MRSVLAFGNALYDVTVSSKNRVREIRQKYNLKRDDQKEISQHEMSNLSKGIQGWEEHISPGGCCQNSLRVLQWLLDKKCIVSIFGSIGNDKEGEFLTKSLNIEGVQTRYIKQENRPTGKTTALIDGADRCLVAHIGAADTFPLNSLLTYPKFNTIYDSSDIIFTEGFFLTHSFETVKHIIQLNQSSQKLIVFNLAGEYIFKIVPQEILYMVNHSHIIFGNRTEYNALTQLLEYPSIEYMAEKLVNLHPNTTLIITNGSGLVYCYNKEKTGSFQPPKLEENEVMDTTGAGDAFIGGYLVGVCLSKTVEESIEIGFYAASSIIKQKGCTIPQYKPNILTIESV